MTIFQVKPIINIYKQLKGQPVIPKGFRNLQIRWEWDFITDWISFTTNTTEDRASNKYGKKIYNQIQSITKFHHSTDLSSLVVLFIYFLAFN